MVQFHMLQLYSYFTCFSIYITTLPCHNKIHLRAPVVHDYTQIVSKMGFTHGQLQIESETYSLHCMLLLVIILCCSLNSSSKSQLYYQTPEWSVVHNHCHHPGLFQKFLFSFGFRKQHYTYHVEKPNTCYRQAVFGSYR